MAVLREGSRAPHHGSVAPALSLVIRRGDPRKIVPTWQVRRARTWSPGPARCRHSVRGATPEAAAALQTQGIDVRPMPPDLHVQPDESTALLQGLLGVHTVLAYGVTCRLPRTSLPPPDSAVRHWPLTGSDDLLLTPSPAPAGPRRARRLSNASRRVRRTATATCAMSWGATAPHLSTYLRFGMCTTAQIGGRSGCPVRSVRLSGIFFWRQLCWREFYAHHLARTPQVQPRPCARICDIAWDNDRCTSKHGVGCNRRAAGGCRHAPAGRVRMGTQPGAHGDCIVLWLRTCWSTGVSAKPSSCRG